MIKAVAQRLVLPDPDAPVTLYLRQTHSGQPVFRSGPGELTVPRGACMRTDTYFNALFPSYWKEHTSAQGFTLRAELSGRCRLRLLRTSITQRAELASADVVGPRQVVELHVPVDQAAGSEPGILFFELHAYRTTRIHDARWQVEAAAARPMVLVAGFCTYRREDYLVRNLETLLADGEVTSHLAGIVVVDNDRSTRLAERLPALSPLIRLRQQGNVGGAGGFTRVLLEALSGYDATHVLLMDDDVRLNSEAVFRARAFLMVAKETVCLGGHMLDLLRPGLLAEAGARADFARLSIEGQWAGLPAVDRRSLWALSRPYEVDYNAWWFCVLPLEGVRAAGLPLPVFVRGDDIEYGCRLKGEGFHTLVLPGIAIWHEPFDAKSGGWQPYFATRNFLIAAACRETGWARKASNVLLRRVTSSLLSCDYHEAWLHCEAVADFLTGPSVLEVDPAAILKKLVSNRSVHQKRVRVPGMRPLPLRERFLFSRRLRKLERRWQMVRHWVAPVSRAAKSHIEGFVAAPHGSWWNLASRDCFVLERPFSIDLEVRCRDPRAFRRLMARAQALRRRLRREESRIGAIWHQRFPELTSARAWERRLGIAAPQPTGIGPEPREPATSTSEARR